MFRNCGRPPTIPLGSGGFPAFRPQRSTTQLRWPLPLRRFRWLATFAALALLLVLFWVRQSGSAAATVWADSPAQSRLTASEDSHCRLFRPRRRPKLAVAAFTIAIVGERVGEGSANGWYWLGCAPVHLSMICFQKPRACYHQVDWCMQEMSHCQTHTNKSCWG